MRSSTCSRSLGLTGLTMALLACLSGTAGAVTVPARLGKSAPYPTDSCFTNSTPDGVFLPAGIINTCTSPARWEIPLAVNQGPHTVQVEVQNVRSDSPFQCALYSATLSGGLITGTTQSAPVNTTGFSTLNLSVTVPAGGVMYVYCSVNYYGKIRFVTYSE